MSERPKKADILREVAERYGFSPAELLRRSRSGDKVAGRELRRKHARDEAMWLMHRVPGCRGNGSGPSWNSLPNIGRFMNGMNHTSVLLATRRHERRAGIAAE